MAEQSPSRGWRKDMPATAGRPSGAQRAWQKEAAVPGQATKGRSRRTQLILALLASLVVVGVFVWVITRPRRTTPLSHAEALESIREMIAAWEVIPLSAAVTLRALEAMPIHTLSFWDALIWSAAVEGAVSVIYTEDFQDGREIEAVRFIDPFAARP